MKKKKRKIGSVKFQNGKIIDAVLLKGKNGKKTVKMQPRRDSLKEEEKILLGHIKEGRLDHLNGYQKISGKILNFKVPIKPNSSRSVPLSQKPIRLQSGEDFLGIYGDPLPSPIIVTKSNYITEVHPPNISGFISGTTIYLGSIDFP